jgi:hypothetical protein
MPPGAAYLEVANHVAQALASELHASRFDLHLRLLEERVVAQQGARVLVDEALILCARGVHVVQLFAVDMSHLQLRPREGGQGVAADQ